LQATLPGLTLVTTSLIMW